MTRPAGRHWHARRHAVVRRSPSCALTLSRYAKPCDLNRPHQTGRPVANWENLVSDLLEAPSLYTTPRPDRVRPHDMTSRILVRRLARLGVAVDVGKRSTVVRAASGSTVEIRHSWYSEKQVQELLAALGVPESDFQDTR